MISAGSTWRASPQIEHNRLSVVIDEIPCSEGLQTEVSPAYDRRIAEGSSQSGETIAQSAGFALSALHRPHPFSLVRSSVRSNPINGVPQRFWPTPIIPWSLVFADAAVSGTTADRRQWQRQAELDREFHRQRRARDGVPHIERSRTDFQGFEEFEDIL